MKIAFVIPAYNEEKRIEKCLQSVLEEVKRTACEAEIVVVNNASTDATARLAGAVSGVRVVDEPVKGLVQARNAGFLATTAELVANIDADTIVPTGWLGKALKEFKCNPNLVVLSGPYIYWDLPLLDRMLVDAFYGVTYCVYIINRFILHIGSVVQGGNFVLRRSALLKVGGFDTSIPFYGEDTDIARRMSKVGAVKWTFRFRIYTSGRRLAVEGIVRTALHYTLNYFSVIFTSRPFSKKYTDVRNE